MDASAKASIQPAATKVANMLYLSSRGRQLCLRHPLFIVSSTLEPTAYPTHDGQYAAAYETYEKEVSPDTLHKSLTLPDSHARNDVRSGNQGSRGSWSESQPFPFVDWLSTTAYAAARAGHNFYKVVEYFTAANGFD